MKRESRKNSELLLLHDCCQSYWFSPSCFFLQVHLSFTLCSIILGVTFKISLLCIHSAFNSLPIHANQSVIIYWQTPHILSAFWLIGWYEPLDKDEVSTLKKKNRSELLWVTRLQVQCPSHWNTNPLALGHFLCHWFICCLVLSLVFGDLLLH